MMTCQDVQLRLSELADGGLTAAERAEIEAHLDSCAGCRGLYNDVQHIRRAAAGLGPITPPDHVWLQVAGQVRIERPATGLRSARAAGPATLTQWLALAAALVVITAGYYFVRTVPSADAPAVAGNASAGPSVQRIADELSQAMKHYDNAITELEALADANNSVLDPEMKETLKQNIQVVNAAIDESRTALEQNPGSQTAQVSLFEALRRKVVVLQATVNLMNEMRKGNQTGTVEAAAVFAKKS